MADGMQVVQCKHCETRYKLPESFPHRTIPCRRCKKPVYVKTQTTARRRVAIGRSGRFPGGGKAHKASPLQIASGVISTALIVGIVVFYLAS
jgi:hypothetical protein